MLYLVQHGEAAKETEDASRPLTDRGRREVEAVARSSARLELGVALIAHSGKLRAKQTADILAAELAPPGGVVERGGLAPNDDPAPAARLAETAAEPLLLVGHLPHLSRLASLLLVGDAGREIVAFRMGALVALSRDEGRWRLRYVLTPEIAEA